MSNTKLVVVPAIPSFAAKHAAMNVETLRDNIMLALPMRDNLAPSEILGSATVNQALGKRNMAACAQAGAWILAHKSMRGQVPTIEFDKSYQWLATIINNAGDYVANGSRMGTEQIATALAVAMANYHETRVELAKQEKDAADNVINAEQARAIAAQREAEKDAEIARQMADEEVAQTKAQELAENRARALAMQSEKEAREKAQTLAMQEKTNAAMVLEFLSAHGIKLTKAQTAALQAIAA